MSVIDSNLYIPSDMQKESGVSDLDGGKVDPVGLLYSDKGFDQYPTYPDPGQDAYDIAVQPNLDAFSDLPSRTIKMLLPEGAANFFAMKAGDIMKYKTTIDNK